MQEITHIPDHTTRARMVSLLRESAAVVAFTGAGISTESGIPDYRGPQGRWTTGKVPNIRNVSFDLESRQRYWSERRKHFDFMASREPNAGHKALVDLYRQDKLIGIITQNIDGLHQKAGMPAELVAELHGSEHWLKCLANGHLIEAATIRPLVEAGDLDPRCPICGSPLRASTVLFGEALPDAAFRQAERWAQAADLMIVVGSSLVVNPAALLPVIARRHGARLVIVNREPTPLDPIADVVANSEAGPTLSVWVAELAEARP